ncbi:hypothetical protein B0T24DRAFT_620144 [Lasiosphaeria ovina]|uniref:Uncharacterized protein n=1 Tax=Lasiosphaeria ovina TaxID=92902 RepID=A0AAE0NAM5_9PEZI|nr:hypothetical protein B0T24DRAFT_620144 [Lasiosphaeria ovina]
MEAKPPNKHYSPHKRTRISMGVQNGKPKSQVALEEGCSPGSVFGIAKRYRVQQLAVALPRSFHFQPRNQNPGWFNLPY